MYFLLLFGDLYRICQIKTSKSFSLYSIPTKKYGVSHGTKFHGSAIMKNMNHKLFKVASCLLVNALADSECGIEPKSTGTKFRATQFPLKQLLDYLILHQPIFFTISML